MLGGEGLTSVGTRNSRDKLPRSKVHKDFLFPTNSVSTGPRGSGIVAVQQHVLRV